MAAAGGDVFDEHLSVIAALRDNYARKEDAGSVAAVSSMQQEIAQLCSRREEDATQGIKGLTALVEETSVRAHYPEGEVPHQQRVERLTEATAAAAESVGSMTATLQSLRGARQALKQQFKELRQKAEHIEQIVNESEPHTRHQLSMYAHVSNVSWSFGAGGERVAGEVSDPDRADIRPFDYDPAATPNFEIANQLWSLMDATPAK